MNIDLSGKTALVTGAGKGIGEACARALAKCGANVVLSARSVQKVQKICDEIGHQAIGVECNVSRFSDLENAVDLAQEKFGGLDILVNNAGVIEPISRLELSDPKLWGEAFDVNLKGVYYGLRAAHSVMKAGGGGVIVNISSGAAGGALEGWSHYCASKAAVLSLTRCADLEWAAENIHVVGLSPGTVATDMQVAIKASGINPVSEMDWSNHISPEWVGKAIAFLASDAGRKYDGGDFILQTEQSLKEVGLIA